MSRKPSMADFARPTAHTPPPTPTPSPSKDRKNVAFRVTEPQRLALIMAASHMGLPSIQALLERGVAALFEQHGLKYPTE